MCGIAGIVHFDGAPIPEGLVARMCGAIQHRGPDDRGILELPVHPSDERRPTVGLGSQRLSIVDIAGGHQPIANEDGTVWTVLNGEIYNFAELRSGLEREGHQFRTRSDTEVIVHAYEQWGDAFPEHLDGMFALALWDDRRHRLVLVRDRFGKKPLVYFDDGNRLAFASELQALLEVPGLPRDIDPDALGTYLSFMAIPAPRTIYRQVKKVPPAHALARDAAKAELHRYWTLAFRPKQRIDEATAVERVRELLDAAVRKRLVAEVPVGAFLSGGLDSSAVVAAMARFSSGPVKTFSIGFDEAGYDELPYARGVAASIGGEHHEFVVRPSAVDILPAMTRHFGEPFADSSAIPSWYLAELTRKHVTVALSGDGGDELFAGYGRHRAGSLAERWRAVPDGIGRPVARLARMGAVARFGGARATRFVVAAALSRAERYRAWAGVFSPDAMASLSGAAAPDASVPTEFEAAEDLDAVDAMLAVDTRFYLPTDLLPKVDITSMAHSLEVRSPLLDRDLAEFAASLPSGLKLKGLTTKHLLKRAVAGMLPAATIRRPKRGFAVPIAHWLRHDLRTFVADHLRPSQLAAAGLVRQPVLDALVAAHLSGEADCAHQLWVVLMLELWYRTFQRA